MRYLDGNVKRLFSLFCTCRKVQTVCMIIEDRAALSDDAAKALVGRFGVRGAARQLGLDKTETDRFRKRVERAGWMQHQEMQQARELILKEEPIRTTNKPIVANVSPLAILANEMCEDAIQGRASGLRITRRTLARYEKCDDDELILPEIVDGVQKTIKSASVVGGYAANSRPDAPAKAFGGRNSGLTLDAEVIQITDTDDVPRTEDGQISTNVEDY
jgi:hypothetical protein